MTLFSHARTAGRAVDRCLKAFGVLAIGLTLSACEEAPPTLRVGSKDFAENMLLAELMAQLAESAGITVQRAIPYGPADTTFEALKQGKLDAYPEYNGTGLVFLGQPPMTDGEAALARVRELFAPLGLEWGDGMGFSNDYVLVMRPETAQTLGIRTISDLAGLEAVDIATDNDFLERPVDGLGAMVRRYGLTLGRLASYSITEGGKDRIVQALLDDEVQVAELFRTDQQIATFDLVVLEDDLDFFPVYEPSTLAREAALQQFPQLAGALAKLAGRITADQMRTMIAEVELEGRSVPAVALDFLVEARLIDETAGVADSGGTEPLVIAMGGLDSLSGPAGKAVRAAKAVFPKRAILVTRAANPLDLVTEGVARLAVAGAESFYTIGGDRAVLSTQAEALGVIGYHVVHIVTGNREATSLTDLRKIGVGELGSAADRVARMVLAGLGNTSVEIIGGSSDDLSAQFEAMSKGIVDAIFVMAPLGDRTVLELMEGGAYRLLPVEGWTTGNAPLRFSFLRPAKIPAGTYRGQGDAVETLSAQVVLAGPSGRREAFGAQGPATTGTAATQPIPGDTVKKLAAALGGMEAVDPAIPAAAALRPELDEGPQRLVADLSTVLVTVATSLFLVWMVYLLVARAPKTRPKEPPRDLYITPADRGE